MTLKDLHPSQFYISEKKLQDAEAWFDAGDLSGFEAIPVKMLDGIPVMTDGHTRAAAALRAGLDTVPFAWDEDDLDWDMYRACVKACEERQVFSPADLLPRIISEEDFWGWEINEQYISSVTASFHDHRFANAISLLAYMDGQVVGRIDSVKWGNYSIISSCWPLLRDNVLHPDGYPLDFATISREYEVAAMTNNISLDICRHYGVELPSDAWYEAGGLDFRNDCGEAITSCMSGLDRDHLQILSEAEELLD